MFLSVLQFYIPAFVKRKVIRELACVTADAFGCAAPELNGLSYKACLREYALFTNEQARSLIISENDIDAVKDKLYKVAYVLGEDMRRRFNITRPEEVMKASRMMYRILDIELQEDGPNGIKINRCYFSRYYSAEVCRIISSLDEGVAAGLSGGGKLAFYQRLTEGNDCCKAHFSVPGDRK